MDLGLKDKVALVTGGSRGIGRTIAHELASEGCHVAITARGGDNLASTKAEIESRGVRGLAIEIDMSISSSPAAAVEQTIKELGAIHVLVNNVGGGFGTRMSKTPRTNSGKKVLAPTCLQQYVQAEQQFH